MKVIHFNHSDIQGGAARAAYRIHQALLLANIDSQVAVNYKLSDDWRVAGPKNALGRMENGLRPYGGAMLGRLLKTGNRILHSPAVLPSRWSYQLQEMSADIVHLHWVCNEMLSVAAIGRLQGPIVWTLHDMWPFCGAEHYTDDFRWRDGYLRTNRPSYESGFDLNRWVWERKRKHWRRPFHIVTPSRWLTVCVRASALMKDWPVTVIPNALDTDVWAPVEKRLARSLLGLPLDEPFVLFGAMQGGLQQIKGFDLLLRALQYLAEDRKDLHLVVFGEGAPRESLDLPFVTHYMGHLHDNVSLRLLYSAADVMVIPSRQDNLPNTGVESLACGTPVVAFDACGLPDIVDHKCTGYLAKAFDTEDLATGINWVVENGEANNLSANARAKALQSFASPLIANKYIDLYRKILSVY